MMIPNHVMYTSLVDGLSKDMGGVIAIFQLGKNKAGEFNPQVGPLLM